MTTPAAHSDDSLALVPTETLPAPMPTFTGDQMRQAFTAYQTLQRCLDESMPDQIIRIDNRAFRRKGYWRAIAVAFHLTVEPLEERRDVQGTFDDGRENFGYIVVYRARTTSGRSASGDGACFAVEKASRQQANRWESLPKQASEHNVRSHAHTRAFNRAVSNLVGFGEVSAEEIDRDDDQRTITPAMRKRLFAVADAHGWKDRRGEMQRTLLEQFGVHRTEDILRADYDRIVAVFEQPPAAVDPEQPF